MFDFFREVGEELCGIDSTAARKERIERKEREKIERFIFSKRAKVGIILLGVLYIVMSGSTIIALRRMAISAGLSVLKYVLMSIDVLVVIFALLFGKQKGEIVALVGTFIFVVGLFLSTVLM